MRAVRIGRWGRAAAFVVVVALTVSLAACRSLVEPDLELRLPPAVVVEGTILLPDATPAPGVEILLTNRAYVADAGLSRRWVLEDGAFRFELPRDFEGYFDVVVALAPGGAYTEYGFLGLRPGDSPLELVHETIPLTGRVTTTLAAPPFDPSEGSVNLTRREDRPGGFERQVWHASPLLDDEGAFDARIPAGVWEARYVRLGDDAFERVDLQLDAAFDGGELDATLGLVPMSLEPQWPAAFAGSLEVTLRVRSPEPEQEIVQRIVLSSSPVDILACGPWATFDVVWPRGRGAVYETVVDGRVDGAVEARPGETVRLFLPSSVLQLEIRRDAAVVESADVTIALPEINRAWSLETDVDGTVVFLCDPGRTYHVEIEVAGVVIEREVFVDDPLEELFVDLLDAVN